MFSVGFYGKALNIEAEKVRMKEHTTLIKINRLLKVEYCSIIFLYNINITIREKPAILYYYD